MTDCSWRERALGVTADKVQEAAQKYLGEASTKELTSAAVLGEINETISKSSEWEKFDFEESQEYEDQTVEAVA